MKKLIVGTVLLASVVGAGVSFAGHGNGNHGRNSSGCAMAQGCGMNGVASTEMRAFHSENSLLFKQMTEKRAELRALNSAVSPDVTEVGKVAGELFDIRTKVHEAAVKSGVELRFNKRMHGQNIDQVTQDKLQEFHKANLGLKKQLMVKQAQKRALFNMETPSPEKAKALAGEIFDIQNTLQVNAEKAGLPVQLACPAMGGKGGGKRQKGMHHGGMGKGSMGNERHNNGHWN